MNVRSALPLGGSSALRLTALGIGIIASIAVARIGGPEVKGVAASFAAANALASAVIALDVGQQIAHAARVSGDPGRSRSLLLAVWSCYLGLASLLAAAFALINPSLLWLLAGALAYTIPAQAAVVALASRGPTNAAVGATLQQLGLLAGACAFGYAMLLDVTTVKVIVIFSYLVPLPYFWHHIPRTGSARFGVRARLAGVAAAVRQGLRWQFGRIAQFALLRLDVLAVALIAGQEEAGIYSVGLSLSSLSGTLHIVVAGNVYHRAHLGQNVSPTRQSLVALGTSLSFALPILILGQPMIRILYGSEFMGAYGAMAATLVGTAAYGVIQVNSAYLRVHGSASSLAWSSAPGVALMVLLLAALVPLSPIIGAGIAFSVGASLSAFLSLWFATRKAREIHAVATP